jgi:two-component system, OmpR family, response regulator
MSTTTLSETPATPPSAKPLERVLCVEDECDIRKVISLSLEKVGGLTICLCSSGGEALQKVEDFAPDLILLDVMMPEMDGPTTLAALRKMEAHASTPIIFMTAKVQKQEVARYMELGAVDVIAKPFKPMQLAEQLRGIWAGLPK